MPTLAEVGYKIKTLSEEAQAAVDSPRLDVNRKKAVLDRIEPRLAELQEEYATLKRFEVSKRSLLAGFGGDPGAAPPDSGAYLAQLEQATAGLDDGGRSVLTGPPALRMGLKNSRSMFDAARGLKSFAVDVKVSDSTGNPAATFPQRILPPVLSRREPSRIAELFGWFASGSPVVEFFVQAARATAGVVAEGALKPGSDVTTPMQLAKAAKIAGWVDVTDEALADFDGFRGLVDEDLTRAVIDQENRSLLSGTGVAPDNITGMLNVTGLLTRVYPVTPPAFYNGLDELVKAETDLRNGPSLADLAAWVMSPTTMSSLRRTKDGQGRFILNPDPSAEEARTLWGKPVVLTTQMADGIALGGDFMDACRGFIRDPLRVVSSNGTTNAAGVSSFKSNVTTVLGEERVGMYIPRPASLIKVSGLPVA